MKKYILLFCSALTITSTVLTVSSCSKKDNPDPIDNNNNNNNNNNQTKLEVKTEESLEASEKVYFNLTTGAKVPAASINATNWDISFYAKGQNIAVAVNSGTEGAGTAGAQIINTGFDDLTELPENGYLPGNEAIGDFMKWSNYTGSTTEPKHAVLPKPGLTIAIKTADGKYAKLQVLSLYKGNPNVTTPEFKDLKTRPEFGYFTFRYVVQTNGSRNF